MRTLVSELSLEQKIFDFRDKIGQMKKQISAEDRLALIKR